MIMTYFIFGMNTVFTTYFPYLVILLGLAVIGIGLLIKHRNKHKENNVGENEAHIPVFDPIRMPSAWVLAGGIITFTGLLGIFFSTIASF